MQQRRPVVAGCAEDPTVAARRHIAARPCIGFLDGTGGKDPLLLEQNRTSLVAALLVGPDPRGDVVDRVDDVLWPIIADQAMRSLRGVAANRYRRVDKKIEPIDRLFDPG